MVRCKARETRPRAGGGPCNDEAGLLSAAVTKDECNAADGRLSTAAKGVSDSVKKAGGVSRQRGT